MAGEEYGKPLKEIKFRVIDDDHARLLIRLRHNNISMAHFFRAIIDGVIEGDDRIIDFLETYVIEHKLLSKGRVTRSQTLRKKGKETVEDFGLLDDAEKENIFDLIAEEFPDL